MGKIRLIFGKSFEIEFEIDSTFIYASTVSPLFLIYICTYVQM